MGINAGQGDAGFSIGEHGLTSSNPEFRGWLGQSNPSFHDDCVADFGKLATGGMASRSCFGSITSRTPRFLAAAPRLSSVLWPSKQNVDATVLIW